MSTGSSYPSFLFDPLRHWLDQLPPRPDSAALVALAEQHPRHVASGQRIRFVPPQDDGKAYECRIWERGEVETYLRWAADTAMSSPVPHSRLAAVLDKLMRLDLA